MADQVNMTAEVRDDAAKGKGPASRLRKTGRVPAIVYGRGVDPTAVHVDALELYHALRTPAGMNVLIRLEVEGKEHLTIIREVQRHAVRGDFFHADFQAVDPDQLIPAEIPVTLANEASVRETGGVVNLVLFTVPIQVRPLEVPTEFTLDLMGMEIGDVRRIEDLASQLPDGASFDIDADRTVVTINVPDELEEPEEELDEEAAALMAGEDGELPEDLADAEGAEDASEVPAEGEEG